MLSGPKRLEIKNSEPDQYSECTAYLRRDQRQMREDLKDFPSVSSKRNSRSDYCWFSATDGSGNLTCSRHRKNVEIRFAMDLAMVVAGKSFNFRLKPGSEIELEFSHAG